MYYPIWGDPTFFIFIVPAMILGFIAQAAVKGRFEKFSKVRTANGYTGAQAARVLLDQNGLADVRIEETKGMLSDYYDPRTRTLNLSPSVARVPSVAAVGVAAHEAGHALQHAAGYLPLQIRSAMVPAVQIGSWLGPLVILAGILLEASMGLNGFGNSIAWFGIFLFAAVTLFSFVTLPVELDASSRAKKLLYNTGLIDRQELDGVNSVLSAAAWTYVAAAIASILQLLRWIFIVSGSRRRN